jgi:pantetheine-phosphate adenylyltransferase
MLADATAHLPNVECCAADGLVVEFARSLGARILVRGVRSATDAEVEIALALANHALAPEIETVFVPARADLAMVSSSRLKELAREGADLSGLCPLPVARRLRSRLGRAPAESRR